MDKVKLFVGNLSYDTTIETLVEVASAHGKVVDSYKPVGKGFGFLTFETAEQAQAALDAMNGMELDGRTLKVDFAQPREERPRRSFSGGGRRDFGGRRDNGGYRNDRRF